MKKANVLFYAGRKGISVTEVRVGHKLTYQVRVPVFAEDSDDPVSFEERVVSDIKAVQAIVDEAWDNDLYRWKAAAWVRMQG